jgi:hypothetical protein
MKWCPGLLLTATALFASVTLEVFGHDWTVFDAKDWSVAQETGAPVLHLVTPRGPLPGPRRPVQFAIAQTQDFGNVTIEADVRPLQRSLILVFSYRDAAHFDYAHLSVDTGTKQPFHNGIFHVYGGERVRISSPDGPPAFPRSGQWYRVKLVHDARGAVNVTVDGRAIPALNAVDVSLPAGKVGLGSFDEIGDFKNVVFSAVADELKSLTDIRVPG